MCQGSGYKGLQRLPFSAPSTPKRLSIFSQWICEAFCLVSGFAKASTAFSVASTINIVPCSETVKMMRVGWGFWSTHVYFMCLSMEWKYCGNVNFSDKCDMGQSVCLQTTLFCCYVNRLRVLGFSYMTNSSNLFLLDTSRSWDISEILSCLRELFLQLVYQFTRII